MHLFPFGQRVLGRPPSAAASRSVFILGAYPSALHVRWVPPAPHRAVHALAVDNEPTPFWSGDDEATHFERWRNAVSWDERFGDVLPAGRANGSSGAWLDDVLRALNVERASAWITDCLDNYRASEGQSRRLADTYRVLDGVVADALPPHPTTEEVIHEALTLHRERLHTELATARPDVVVTLGNAALHVFASLADASKQPLSTRGYARRRPAMLQQRAVTWIPLVHPGGCRGHWQTAHSRWLESLS